MTKEDSVLEALGQEIDREDCSLLNEGPNCEASAFLQTGAAGLLLGNII